MDKPTPPARRIRPRRVSNSENLPRYIPVDPAAMRRLSPEQRKTFKDLAAKAPALRKELIKRAELHERVGRKIDYLIGVRDNLIRPPWLTSSLPLEKAEKAPPAKKSTSKPGKRRGRGPKYDSAAIRALAEEDKKDHGCSDEKYLWFDHVRGLCDLRGIATPESPRTMDRYIGDLYVPPK